MFEKEAEEYADEKCGTIETEEKKFCRIDWQRGAEFGYNLAKEEIDYLNKHWGNGKDKANEWHYVKDGDLPKENQECYFIYSNTYDKSNKVNFAKSNINVRTGIYTFFLDEDGEQTTDPCFYDDVTGDEWGLSEVYAWKEIVLPELKESE